MEDLPFIIVGMFVIEVILALWVIGLSGRIKRLIGRSSERAADRRLHLRSAGGAGLVKGTHMSEDIPETFTFGEGKSYQKTVSVARDGEPLIPFEQQTARIAALADALAAVNVAVEANLCHNDADKLMGNQRRLVGELTMACRQILVLQGTPEVEAV